MRFQAHTLRCIMENRDKVRLRHGVVDRICFSLLFDAVLFPEDGIAYRAHTSDPLASLSHAKAQTPRYLSL